MRCPTLEQLPAPPPEKTGWPWTEETPQLPEKMPDGREWPTISVVTATCNQEQFIEETIRTVLLQSYPNLDYIIINDGSTDGTVDVIRKYEQYIDCWINQENHGQSYSINKGFSNAKGDIFCWLNSDDLFKAGALGFVGKAMEVIDQPAWIVGTTEIIDSESAYIETRTAGEITYASLLDWLERWFPQQSTFWTRTLWNEAGPLENDLHYVMDFALWIRMFDTVQPRTIDETLSAYRYQQDAKCIAQPEKVTEEVNVVLREYLKNIPKKRFFKIQYDLERVGLTRMVGNRLLTWAHIAYRNQQYHDAKQYLTLALQLHPPLRKERKIGLLKFKLSLNPKVLNILRGFKHPELAV